MRIGLTTALTGAYSEFGEPMENSIRLAIDEFNESGACDQEVELIAYDDQLVAETAQANMRRLLGEDDVDFIMSPAGSGPTLAVLPLVNSENKIMMNTIAQTSTIVTPEGQDEPYNNVFSFSLGNVVEAEFMGQYLSENFDTVGLIAESTPYGETGLNEIEMVLEEAGVEVVARESYDQGATDVTAQLARIQQANPGAIAMVGLGADTATIRQGMARLNMLETPFVISNGAGTIPYQERAAELVDGTIVVQYEAFSGGEPETESARNFAQMYLEAYGNDRYYGEGEWPVPAFGGTPASSYDGAKVLLDAFERAGCSTETEAVIEQIESGDAFEAARGEYTFSDTEHTAVTTDFLVPMVYRVGADGAITYERAEG
ncbi:amino acid/amide ABC transporter substrate-binding protein (HAAT family) [Blastococcus colisei]|uniref:Amino acid/amide ABC transporter substrate-binding protein (HAAT family) n=1 Tax=Blastococcus colisei TaxID=1564162 RepID=A0A543PG50_9ACTN|nr:ABC transporter substrate-binding protein [Blastococcus colisei]TQN43053.1 amino acid/amide ABC transporter substrate-binding protein (HAAT family) [Blastococcus colisei]